MKNKSDFRTPPDGEATLPLPRFDASEASAASPVVPLSEVRDAPPPATHDALLSDARNGSFAQANAGSFAQARGESFAQSHEVSPAPARGTRRGAAAFAAFRDWRGVNLRRSWPLALLLVGVLAAGVVGSAVYRQQRAARLAAESGATTPEAAPVDNAPARAAQADATSDAAGERRPARRAAPRPARRGVVDGDDDAAALAGFALGGFVDGGDDEDKKERKGKRRGRRGGGDDDGERSSRGQRRKASRSDGTRLVDVIRHD